MNDEMEGEFPANDRPPEGFKTWQEYYKYNDDLQEYNRLKAQRDRFAELDKRFSKGKISVSSPQTRPAQTRPAQSAASNAAGTQANPLPNSIKVQANAKEGQWISTSRGPIQLTKRDIAWAKSQINRPASSNTSGATINNIDAATYKSNPKIQTLSQEVAALKAKLASKEAELNKLLGK